MKGSYKRVVFPGTCLAWERTDSFVPVNNTSNGKEIDWSKVDLDRSTAQERLLYGSAIQGLRKALDLTQAEVADAANVSARTVRNIEKGDVAAQPAVLKRILLALDVTVGGVHLRPETEMWLSILGPLIEALPEDSQTAVMKQVLRTLTRHINAGRHSAASAVDPKVLQLVPTTSVGRLSDDELRHLDLTQGDLDLAAGDDRTTDDEDTTTP